MRKVWVKKEIPFFTVGQIIELDEQGQIWFRARGQSSCYNRYAVEEMLSDKWLEEVVEEKSLEQKLFDGINISTLKPFVNTKKIAQIAMQHAVEVALKAKSEYLKENPRGMFADDWIITKLKQESELNKTKEG